MFRSFLDNPIKRAERDLRQTKQQLAREARKKQQELLIRKKNASATQEKYPVWKLDLTLDSFYEDYSSQDPVPNRRLRKEQSKERKEFFLLLFAFCLLTWIAVVILRHTLS